MARASDLRATSHSEKSIEIWHATATFHSTRMLARWPEQLAMRARRCEPLLKAESKVRTLPMIVVQR